MGAAAVHSPPADPLSTPGRAGWLLAAGMILFALGAKLALIDRYGTDQPFADQWVAEGVFAVREPHYFQQPLRNYFFLHGEHRPTLTRIWTRGLLAANGGQWDCRVELVANLAIFGALLLLVWGVLAPLVPRGWRPPLAGFMAALAAQPAAYENFLWGFQSCFLLLLLAAVAHVAGTLRSERPGWRWAWAQLAGLLGLFSVAAGVASAAALVAMAAGEILRGRRGAWAWATLTVNGALVALGLWMLPDFPAADGGRGTALLASLVRTGYLLAWPLPASWWGLCFQLPGLALLFRWIRGGCRDAGDRLVVGLGLWLWVTAFIIAYGRLITPGTIGVRYYDVFLLGLWFNGVALVRLLAAGGAGRRAWLAVGGLWIGLLGPGLWTHNKPGDLRATLQYQRDLAVEQQQVITRFFASGDATELEAFASRTGRFPHMAFTLDLLRDENIRAKLPPSLAPGGATGVLSKLAPAIAALWALVMGAGLLLLGFGWWRWLRSRAPTA